MHKHLRATSLYIRAYNLKVWRFSCKVIANSANMGNNIGKESKSDCGSSDSVDVSDFIRQGVKKMIANAVVAREKDWAIDMERDKVKSFIEQKIQLLPSSNQPTGVVRTVSIVYNGTKRAVHIPISHRSTATRYVADNTSTTYGIEGGGKVEGKVSGKDGVAADAKADTKDGGKAEADAEAGVKGEASVTATADLKGSWEHKHTQSDIRKTNKEDNRGELDVGPGAHQNISQESREFVIELEIRARKKAKVVVHQLSEANYGAKVGAAVGAAAFAGGGAIGGLGGAAAGAAIGSVVPVAGTIVGAVAGAIIGAIAGAAAAPAVGAGAGAGIGGAVTELATVTLTAEEIFKTNEGINEYRVKGDYVHVTLKHVYTAPVEKATVNPH